MLYKWICIFVKFNEKELVTHKRCWTGSSQINCGKIIWSFLPLVFTFSIVHSVRFRDAFSKSSNVCSGFTSLWRPQGWDTGVTDDRQPCQLNKKKHAWYPVVLCATSDKHTQTHTQTCLHFIKIYGDGNYGAVIHSSTSLTTYLWFERDCIKCQVFTTGDLDPWGRISPMGSYP